ncbi:Gp37 family protein [Pseudomonas sp. QTF5]|uniref:Gp37 family protein n=1 Tax=Pseudomonas sp. QTF5 TaxID=1435425 RepID=UPI0004AD47A6|nr:Gp37 family protein [Pseudomonas sp. QTF5]
MTQLIPKTQTEQLMDAVLAKLQHDVGHELMVELFPENPQQYRLNHPRGAVLLAYGKSIFGGTESTDAIVQARNVVLRLTLIFRQLNGTSGVICYLDRIRACLIGWYPPNAAQACRPLSEQFIGHQNGVWQYAQDFATRTTQLQSMPPEQGPLLKHAAFQDHP